MLLVHNERKYYEKLMGYIQDFERCGEIRDEVVETGDYKKGNKTKKITDKIFNIARTSDEKEEFYLTILEMSKSPSIITTCCVQMMKLELHPVLARKNLEEIADIDSVFGFNARKFLEEWDKGNIKPVN